GVPAVGGRGRHRRCAHPPRPALWLLCLLAFVGSCAADSGSSDAANAGIGSRAPAASPVTATTSKPRRGPPSGSVRIYYVRADGGEASECTGLVDAPLRDG